MPAPATVFAVHVDAVVPTRDHLDPDVRMHDAMDEAVRRELDRFEVDTMEFASGNVALFVAERLKLADPEQLVTVVVWHEPQSA